MVNAFSQRQIFAQFWSLTTGILMVLFGLTLFFDLTIVAQIFGFLLVPSFISLMACLYRFAPPGRHASGLAAIAFSVLYGTLIGLNYFTQISFELREIPAPEFLAMYESTSLFWVIEILGYFFMGLSTFAAANTIESGRLGHIIKFLLYFNAILGIGGLMGFLMSVDAQFMFVGVAIWNIIMPTAAILLFFYFRKNEGTSHHEKKG